MSLFNSPGNKMFVWVVGVLFCWLFQSSFYTPSSPTNHSPLDKDTAHYLTPEPVFFYGFPVEEMHVEEKRVARNQRFVELLKGYDIAPSVMQQINLLPRQVFNFRRIAVNKKYTLISDRNSPHTLKALVYEPDLVNYVIFHTEDSLRIEQCRREIVSQEKIVVGVIQSSLYETIKALDLSPVLTNRFVDIFSWQIDFQRLQQGDLFKLIYEKRSVNGQFFGIGKIKGIYFNVSGYGYCAIPFDQGKGVNYFDIDGKSLDKALLKYPIEFTRISSRYTRRRFHPVSKVFRSHLGTDFAAPIGTPIRSAGDGVVVEARYKIYNGNYVKIRHNNLYTTQYLHMSKIALGVHKGKHVRKGQIIGFVGKTGLATGPHLCYRFWRNNVQVDALKVKLPSSASIMNRFRSSFLKESNKILHRLDSISLEKG